MKNITATQNNEKQTGCNIYFEQDYQKNKRKEKSLISSSFFLCCSLVFALGLPTGLFAKSINAKLILAVIFFCIIYRYSRNKLAGRIVYGGMEKPFAFSLGATIFFLGSLFSSQKMDYFGFAILCYIFGIYFFYQGYKEGPLYGWENFFRRLNE
ncbi:MAG: hypothetical protein US70_C0005G0033 [Parcubacteria group bacterium GW2011_GWD2_38_11]|nr:MAG: hypothetical protein US70_C0005G0033 [Parcubacteria group bacterium GW2011_GWD2_38_11]